MTAPDTSVISDAINRLAQNLRISCAVAFSCDENDARTPLTVSINTAEDAKFLIGKNGQNLMALEHVLRAIWARRNPGAGALTVDVNDYRKERTGELVKKIHETARRVRDSRRSEALEPMTSYERRMVHTELAAYHDLASESVGQDPHRRVVIKPL